MFDLSFHEMKSLSYYYEIHNYSWMLREIFNIKNVDLARRQNFDYDWPTYLIDPEILSPSGTDHHETEDLWEFLKWIFI